MSGLTVFLTGAGGFVGSHLLRALEARPDVERIYCLVRRPLDDVTPKTAVVLGSLEDVGLFANQLIESDYVFHLGANAVFGEGQEYHSVNAAATRRIAGILSGSSRLRSLVFASTIGAVDRAPGDRVCLPLGPDSPAHPNSDYGRSKLEAEDAIRESGVAFTILRLAWVYGAGMRRNSHVRVFVDMARRRNPLLRLRFPGAVSLIHVQDAVRAFLAVMGNSAAVRRTYLAATETLTLGEIFATVWKETTGKRPVQVPVPSLRPLMSRVHGWLPLGVKNLLLPYLVVEDRDFVPDLGVGRPRRFRDGVGDVVSSFASDDDWWAITGANGGIGLALARILANEGRKLILLDKDVDTLEAEFGGGRHLVCRVDLATEEGLDRAVRLLRSCKLRCLVNNAGVGFKGATADVTAQQFLLTMDLNCKAPVLLVKGVLRNIVQHGTTIVNIGSTVAYNPLPGMALYASSKSFLVFWSEALACELRRTNRVVTLSPSGTRTDFQRRAGVRDHGGRGLLRPEDVARRIRRRIDFGSPVGILGARSKPLLLVSRLLPRAMNARLWGFLFERNR